MPRGFWNFSIGHAITILGGVFVAWMGTLAIQNVVTQLQAASIVNAKAVLDVATDLKEYRVERARRDERTDRVMAKISEDVAYLRGRSDAPKVP